MKSVQLAERESVRIEGTTIGQILVEAGRLSVPDLHRVIALQGKENILFGEAAVALGTLTEEDVRWALACQYSYPCLGHDHPSVAGELLTVHEPFSSRVESFRSIRSGLVLSGVGKVIRSFGVMSPDVGEGKSFVAANLAVVFAQLGSRTLLADLNFRSPRLQELFQLKNNIGMSSLIIKRALPENAVQKTSIDALDVLPSGPKPPNPLELLSWSDTSGLLENLKKQYDVIIVDTPAAASTTDALVIGGLCDGAVLVARQGRTRSAPFSNLKKQLESAGTRILGSVVNEIAASR